MSRQIWEAVEAKVRKIGVAKTEGRRSERRTGGEERGKGAKEEKAEKRKKMEIKKVVKEQKIWNKEEKAVR